MNDFTYTNLLFKSFSGFLIHLRKCFFSIIILSMLTPLLKFCLYRVLGDFLGGWYIFSFDIFFKPILLIALFITLTKFISVMDISFYRELLNKARSKYAKLLLLHFVITFFSVYLGSGVVILYSVVFLKIPFIEVMIFRSKVSVLEAVRRNNAITQDKLLRYLLMVLFCFLLIRLFIIRGSNSINTPIGGEVLSIIMEFIKSLLSMFYFSYIFAFYNVLKEEKLYLK